LQNEKRNPVHPDSRESLAVQAARKLTVQENIQPADDERKRWEEFRAEDPERWDGMS
jgi:hypothetical protein